jgi:hypothetical protein
MDLTAEAASDEDPPCKIQLSKQPSDAEPLEYLHSGGRYKALGSWEISEDLKSSRCCHDACQEVRSVELTGQNQEMKECVQE